ncbi:glycosyltransferase [Chlamydiota bacterium]
MEHHISIVMPVHNRVNFLTEAVESVLHQNHTNYELIIVVDGGPFPKIKEELKTFENHSQITILLHHERGGPGRAINAGAYIVKGEYFCRLDSDDKLLPDAIKTLNCYINKYPHVSYFYSSRYVIDEYSNIVLNDENFPQGIHRSKKFDKALLHEEYHCNHLICWKRNDFLSIGGMKNNMFWAEDWDLALRMSERYLFQNIDESLYCVREHSTDRLTCMISDEEKNTVVQEMLACITKERAHS